MRPAVADRLAVAELRERAPVFVEEVRRRGVVGPSLGAMAPVWPTAGSLKPRGSSTSMSSRPIPWVLPWASFFRLVEPPPPRESWSTKLRGKAQILKTVLIFLSITQETLDLEWKELKLKMELN